MSPTNTPKKNVLTGNEILYQERRDSGGMFDATLQVEKDPSRTKLPYRAFIAGSFGGGVQCYRATEEEAKAELPRLWEKMFGEEH